MSTNGFSEGRVSRQALKVMICFRAPLGGLFRHVSDLAEGLAARGVEVGLLCAADDHGALWNQRLGRLEHVAALGLHRTAMPRTGGVADISACRRLAALVRSHDADIVHGHGAKGGAYARVAGRLTGRPALYTPHGGSLHYSPGSPSGLVFLTLERLLAGLGSGILFESEYGARTYSEKVGPPKCPTRVVHNGLQPQEFEPVPLAGDAADLLFLGEMRELKGVHVLLQALARLQRPREVTAVLVGSGTERLRFEAMAGELGLAGRVRFADPMPAREAFGLARMVVVPSLAESLPYVVLEAIAAGRPLVATKVGGIPEIFGPLSQRLVRAGDAEALAAALCLRLDSPEETLREAAALRDHVRVHFSTGRMVEAIVDAYHGALGPAGADQTPASASSPAA